MKYSFVACIILLAGVFCYYQKTITQDLIKNPSFINCVVFKNKNAPIKNRSIQVNSNYTNTYMVPNSSSNKYSPYKTQTRNTSGTNYPKVTLFENKLFQKSYSNESIYNRLARIENKIFGRIYTNYPLIDRMDKIAAKINPNNFSNQKEFYSSTEMNQVPANAISIMEDRLFNKKYQNDNLLNRIERLERNLFGAVQSGEINKRVAKLKLASQRQVLNDFNIPSFTNQGQSYSQSNTGTYSPYGNAYSTQQNGYSNSGSPGILDYIIPMIKNKFLNYNNNNNSFFSNGFNNSFYDGFGSTFGQSYGSQSPTHQYYENKNTNYATGMGVTILND